MFENLFMLYKALFGFQKRFDNKEGEVQTESENVGVASKPAEPVKKKCPFGYTSKKPEDSIHGVKSENVKIETVGKDAKPAAKKCPFGYGKDAKKPEDHQHAKSDE